MPTQLQLDGPDLETLLARVRTELGPTARILRAEKVRSGGVAGFFARERYEITVEADDPDGPAPAPDTTPVTTIPRSLMDLADEVSANERSAALSTETAGFADVLRSLIREGGPAADVDVPQPRAAEPAGLSEVLDRLAAGAADVTAPAPRAAQVVRPRVVAPRPVPNAVPWTPATLDPTGLDSLDEPEPADEPESGPEAEVERVRPVAAVPAAVVAAVVAAPDDPEPPATPVAPAVTAPVAPRPAVRTVAPPAAATVAPAAPLDAGQRTALVRLGLPAHLLPPVDGPGGYPALVETLRALPKAPRIVNRAGQVLAVVGPGHLGLAFARQVAAELGLNPATAVHVAGESADERPVPARQALADPAVAAQRRAGWRRRKDLTIVVVEAPLTAAGAVRAAEYLEAVQPRSTWAVVEASRKPYDIGAWVGLLGGVDALAVQEVESTLDPAAVLALGIPVGRLGTRPATPATWASLLSARAAA